MVWRLEPYGSNGWKGGSAGEGCDGGERYFVGATPKGSRDPVGLLEDHQVSQ